MNARHRNALWHDGLIIAVIVSAALTAASVIYQLTEHEHVHPGVPTGWEADLGIVTDAIGLIAITLMAIQLTWGYRLVAMPRPAYNRRHPVLGIAIAVAAVLHGASGVWHSTIGQIEAVPIWLDYVGAGMVSLLAFQMVSGYRLRAVPTRDNSRMVHVIFVVLLALVIAGHSLLGVYHTVTG